MRSLSRTATTPRQLDPVLSKALPVGLAVGAYGISYGVLAVAAGLSPLVTTLSSVLVLGGGSQFTFVGVLAAGGAPLTGALGGLLLNLRYLAFGLAIAPHLPGGSVARRAVDSYLIVDESVGIALAGPRHDTVRRYRIVGWTVVVSWIGMTALGAYGGALLGDPETWGLDAAFPAGFLALLAPWLRTRPGRVAAATGVVLAVALTPFTPPGVPILAAGLGALVAMRVAVGTPGTADGPTADGPTADRPAADGTTADGPTADGPTADGPTADGPAGQDP